MSDSLQPHGLSMEFSRKEHWGGLPFSSGDLPDLGIKPGSPVSQANFFTIEPPGKPMKGLISPQISKNSYSKSTVWKWFLCHMPCAVLSHLVMSDSFQPHGLWPIRLLCPWDSPHKNTWVGCHACLQGILSTQGSNPGLPHGRQILYWPSHQGCMTHGDS